jgi:hypothetical protein
LTGRSLIWHFGQLPGLDETTSGCIGHVYFAARRALPRRFTPAAAPRRFAARGLRDCCACPVCPVCDCAAAGTTGAQTAAVTATAKIILNRMITPPKRFTSRSP